MFRELADYFSSITPAIQDASVENIAALLQEDIDNYTAVRATADAAGDRGAARICVWGEKVTRMLSSLVSRYLREGETMLADTAIWVCTVCGFVYIGENVQIGDGTRIYPNVTIYDGCRIGQRVTIHAGAVIGADGFGFAPNQEGYEKIPQIGIVIIEDDVEIGANTCIDRSTMGQTIIHHGVKLDNLVQVAHNCEIGESTVMSAQVGLAGSTKVGSWCMVGGQAGFSGHIKVADRTIVGAQCGVIKDTKGDGETLIGSPAMNPKVFFKAKAIYAKLPDMYRELAALRREVEELKKLKS